MRQFYYYVFLFLIIISCQHSVSEEDIVKINGYWEIQKVTFPDGNEKNYSINETIDFFEWKNEKGFRKKLKPQFDGTFLANEEQEQIMLQDSAGMKFVFYHTKFDDWKEEIKAISDSVLILKNMDNITYQYKRFIPFSVK